MNANSADDPSPKFAAGLSLQATMIGRLVMERSRIVTFAAVALIGGSAVSYAGPCTTQISQVEQRIRTAAAKSGPGGAGDASAQQSVGAQLHHQPTPGSVQSAERMANADGEAALTRARNADAAGDARACNKALAEAKAIYGID
jgi:hypothetical protein